MLKRSGAPEAGENRGEYTFGHNLLTVENIQKLSEQASYWAVVLKFDNNDEEAPTHGLFPKAGLLTLFDQGRLSRATLLAGFRTAKAPKRPVPACFFRTLDFLLQFLAAGNSYRAITDKEDAKGFPPAAWCRPPVVTPREEAEMMTAAAVQGATPAALERAPATDPIRLFYAARAWCVIFSFHFTASSARLTVGLSPAEMYEKYCEGQLSDYLPVLGLAEDPPPNVWVPPCVMMPLGSLLYMHEHGRPYLPLTLGELRDIRGAGIMSVAVRPDARPLRLPPGVWPVAEHPALPPGLDAEALQSRRSGIVGDDGGAGPSSSSRGAGSGAGGAGSNGGGGASRQTNRVEPAAAAGAGVPPVSPTAAAAGSGRQGSTATQRAGGSSTATEPPRPPDPEPDPILNSANWIMPKPFDAPMPIPPSASSGALDGDAAVASGGAEEGGDAAAPAAAALPSSPFLQCNSGVQPTYETPPLRLFLGERGQYGLSANWWYVDSESNSINGPYSPEAMLLSFITPCREISFETLVCGSEADVRPPMLPPLAAFLPLGDLLRDINEGSYVLVSRKDIIVSPLQRSFLGPRIRASQQEPVPTAPSPVPSAAAPVVITLQPQQPQQQAQTEQQTQPQPQKPPQVALSQAAMGPGPVTVQVLAPPPAPVPQPTQQPQHAPGFQPQPQVQVQSQPQPVAPGHHPQQLLQQPHQAPHQQPYLQPQPQAHAQPQPQPTGASYTPLGASVAVHNAVRGLPLPHLMAARPRPVPMPGAAAAAVPAYTLPGSMVYMPQYGQPMPYNSQSVMAQPVLFGAQTQHAMPSHAAQQQ